MEASLPDTIFTLVERKDGWDDVRRDLASRKRNLDELKRVSQPILRPLGIAGKWAAVLSREAVLVGNRWTIASRPQDDEPYPVETHWTSSMLEAESLDGVTADSVPEPLPILANTIFTLEDRPDGWDDARAVLRKSSTELKLAQEKAKTISETAALASGAVLTTAALPPLASALGVAKTVTWAADVRARAKAEDERVQLARAEALAQAKAKLEEIERLRVEVEALEVAAGKR